LVWNWLFDIGFVVRRSGLGLDEKDEGEIVRIRVGKEVKG
jgi:hypothetical protein